MPKTRRQTKSQQDTNESRRSVPLTERTIPGETLVMPVPMDVPSTSVVSVQTDREVGHAWGHPLHDLEGMSTQCSIEMSLINRKRMGDVLKLARDIIPTFDGTNMSVDMFVEHCRAAATTVNNEDMHLLIMLIKNSNWAGL